MAAKKPVSERPGAYRGDENDERISGSFTDLNGERYYVIRNADVMQPFFTSVISSDDHWLFVSSTGGLTAGRVSPDTALFPYITVDKIHDSTPHTGGLTVLRVASDDGVLDWQPFSDAHGGRYARSRNLYKSVLGDKLCFEEVNHDLKLAFRVTWKTSGKYGFVRDCELENLSSRARDIDMLDGLQNVLPAGTPRFTQTNSSNLVDAYKWTEADPATGLALFTLYSGITDRAEPCESLRANTAFCLGLDDPLILLSSEQVKRFRSGLAVSAESLKRGIRGAFLVQARLELPASAARRWQIVANTEQSQVDVIAMQRSLGDRSGLSKDLDESVRLGTDRLARTLGSADAFQVTAEDNVTAHHYSNVMFNVLRGGIFSDQYSITARDLRRTIRLFNRTVYADNRALLDGLPDKLDVGALITVADESGDPQFKRLCHEYLPITFGRRHGDPSRPWNQFAIRLRDDEGEPLLSYEGNWRDVFQNWEALAFSFPGFVESMIAKFVNASTLDGYNPYRITKEGIDWEVEDPDDPWSYIGYWGDHQIIYLLKLLELSLEFHPDRLKSLLREPLFAYANVPYRIRSFDKLLRDPKNTVEFDEALAGRIEQRIDAMGADGKLVLDQTGQVLQVNLLEKLLVPLLSKLGNLVIDGGIWMNTQRPEWNDANNALVGHGLSMVTLYYLRRYVRFLEKLLDGDLETVTLSSEVAEWMDATRDALADLSDSLTEGPSSAAQRLDSMTQLGSAASDYRRSVYEQEGVSGTVSLIVADIGPLLSHALQAIDHSIACNRRTDGLYNAYNLLDLRPDGAHLERLYPMLEGQVAALSAGSIGAGEAADVVTALFESPIYREDQDSFMLYPDRELPSFLEKNRIPDEAVESAPILGELLTSNDRNLVVRDADGRVRFHPDIANGVDLQRSIDSIEANGLRVDESARNAIAELYETVFNHQAFTGRSGTMFGFEGLGCVYWHMVAKLLLALQENYFAALERGEPEEEIRRLGTLYYRVRQGIGFNKTPGEFGAFPIDPYSHTPKHAGARQPGMTGQVKEEILTRFGELGVRVENGRIRFVPKLLRRREFLSRASVLRYLDTDGAWQEVGVPEEALGFTWCQIPFVYRLTDAATGSVTASFDNGETAHWPSLDMPTTHSASVFERKGRVRRLDLSIPRQALFKEE